jgi:hypothetical protein
VINITIRPGKDPSGPGTNLPTRSSGTRNAKGAGAFGARGKTGWSSRWTFQLSWNPHRDDESELLSNRHFCDISGDAKRECPIPLTRTALPQTHAQGKGSALEKWGEDSNGVFQNRNHLPNDNVSWSLSVIWIANEFPEWRNSLIRQIARYIWFGQRLLVSKKWFEGISRRSSHHTKNVHPST